MATSLDAQQGPKKLRKEKLYTIMILSESNNIMAL